MLTLTCSGAIGARPTNRNAPTATAADRCYSPAVCQHGHDPTTTAAAQSIPAATRPDAKPERLPQPQRLPIPARSDGSNGSNGTDGTAKPGYPDD